MITLRGWPASEFYRRESNARVSMPKEASQKTFSLHWGEGIIEEEAQITTPYHRPTFQLLKFLEGQAAGTYEIRFCHYDKRGRFSRSPLIIDERDLATLRKALKTTPKLRRLLARMVRDR